MIHWLIDWIVLPFLRLIDWVVLPFVGLIDWLIGSCYRSWDWLIDWLIESYYHSCDWLIGWLTCVTFSHLRGVPTEEAVLWPPIGRRGEFQRETGQIIAEIREQEEDWRHLGDFIQRRNQQNQLRGRKRKTRKNGLERKKRTERKTAIIIKYSKNIQKKWKILWLTEKIDEKINKIFNEQLLRVDWLIDWIEWQRTKRW